MLFDTTELPRRLLRRPRDPRGFPVPFTQWLDPATGVPDFRVLDQDKVGRCLSTRLCALCGEALGGHVHFIGGPESFRSGLFHDPGMHRDCAVFALKTCPHLARTKGRYRAFDDLARDPRVQERALSGEKASVFALMHAKRFAVTGDRRQGFLDRAELPWLDATWWKDGRQLAEGPDPPGAP